MFGYQMLLTIHLTYRTESSRKTKQAGRNNGETSIYSVVNKTHSGESWPRNQEAAGGTVWTWIRWRVLISFLFQHLFPLKVLETHISPQSGRWNKQNIYNKKWSLMGNFSYLIYSFHYIFKVFKVWEIY